MKTCICLLVLSMELLLTASDYTVAVVISHPDSRTGMIVEYSLETGKHIRLLTTLQPVSNLKTEWNIRDITQTNGKLYAIMGTYEPAVIACAHPYDIFFHPGWSFADNPGYGACDSRNGTIVLADMYTAHDGRDSGILTFDTDSKKFTRHHDSASIVDITVADDDTYVVVDDLGRLLQYDPSTNGGLKVILPKPLGQVPECADDKLTCALALNNGDLVFGTQQGRMVYINALGQTDIYRFGKCGAITDLDRVGTRVIVCTEYGSSYWVIDCTTREQKMFLVTDRYVRFACAYPAQQKSDPGKKNGPVAVIPDPKVSFVK